MKAIYFKWKDECWWLSIRSNEELDRLRTDEFFTNNDFTDPIYSIWADEIDKGREIFINEKGTWRVNDTEDFEQFSTYGKLKFPHFHKNDYWYKATQDGKYYAFLGDTPIKNGNQWEFDSYDEAEKYAMRYVED